jgi:hypothetical protein
MAESVPESESELLYDWRFIANRFVLAVSPSILQPNICGYNYYATSSLIRRMDLSFTVLHYAISRNVVGSIPDEVIEFFT